MGVVETILLSTMIARIRDIQASNQSARSTVSQCKF